MIFGFGLKRDENFLRWLFLERTRLHRTRPDCKTETSFVDTARDGSLNSKPFLEGAGMEFVSVPDYEDIYENPAWRP